MKAKDIKVGGKYIAKVGGSETTVEVLSTGLGGMGKRQRTTYRVKNLRTGRETMFRSAAKFRCEAGDEDVIRTTVSLKPSPVAPEYPMPRINPPKKFGPVVDAGGGIGIQVEVIDTPKKVEAAMVGILNGKETADQTMARVLLPKSKPARKSPTPNPVPTPTVIISPDTLDEIREFEKKIGRPWWMNTGAEKGETWESFKRRGCPETPPAPITPKEVEKVNARYAGLNGSTTPPANPAPGTPAIPRSSSGANPKPSEPRPPKPAKADGAPSNKEIVYKVWLGQEGTPDIAATAALVPEVQLSTVKSWMSMWSKGKSLPACSKALPPSLKGKYGKVEVKTETKGKTPRKVKEKK